MRPIEFEMNVVPLPGQRMTPSQILAKLDAHLRSAGWVACDVDAWLIDWKPDLLLWRVSGQVVSALGEGRPCFEVDVLRCECGSGSNTRGPGHSDWCKLWVQA